MTQYINIRCIDNIDSIDNFIHPSIGPSVHLFLYLSICASICLCIYIYIYVYRFLMVHVFWVCKH